MNFILSLSMGQLLSIAISGGLLLAVGCVKYVDWTIKRDARRFPSDPDFQAAVASMQSRGPVGAWLSVASYSTFFGAVLGVLAIGFGWPDVLQFAGLLFFLGAGTLIGFMFRGK